MMKSSNRSKFSGLESASVDRTGNDHRWSLPVSSPASQKYDSQSQSTKTRSWVFGKSWRGQHRTRSISEADLASAAEAITSFVAPDDRSSPVQLPPPPMAVLRRSLTMPTMLQTQRSTTLGHRNSMTDEYLDYFPASHRAEEKDDLVMELQRQLDERDAKMVAISQEAMFSVSQLHELTAIVMEMKTELDSLKAENDRLQRLVEQDKDPVPPPTASSSSSVTPKAAKADGRRVTSSGSASSGLRRPDGQEVTSPTQPSASRSRPLQREVNQAV